MDGAKIAGGGGIGGAIGAAAIYVAGRFGAHLAAEDGALIASGCIAGCAFIVHNGLRGCARVIWRGQGAKK